jgi:hypothetical protein
VAPEACAAGLRYPWDTWLDGRPWKLTRAEDYESRASTVVQNARTQAKRRGGNVRTRVLNEGDASEAVVIQFRREQ